MSPFPIYMVTSHSPCSLSLAKAKLSNIISIIRLHMTSAKVQTDFMIHTLYALATAMCKTSGQFLILHLQNNPKC